MGKKSTTDKFIEKANIVHKNKYDYSLVNYISKSINVKIICKIHGIFEQTPDHHLCGCNCQKCSILIKKSNTKKTSKSFSEECSIKFNNKYDYSKFIYKCANKKSIICCPIHGEFTQTPSTHLKSKYGCPFCSKLIVHEKLKNTKYEFIEKANILHNNFYKYDSFNYINFHTKGTITCPKHGDFEQSPAKHLDYRGCPMCSNKKNKNECCLYIFHDNMLNLYKIGISKNYKNRLTHIKIVNKNINVIYIKENFGQNEFKIHRKYRKYRKNHPIMHGGYTEWFDFYDLNIDDVIKYINSI